MAVKVIGAGLAGCEAAWQSVWDDASAGLLNAANSPIFSNKRGAAFCGWIKATAPSDKP